MQYYLVVAGQRKGPFGKEELVAQGLEHDTLVWHPGRTHWTNADQIADLKDVLVLIPPPVPMEVASSAIAATRLPPVYPDVIRHDVARDGPAYTPSTFRKLYLAYLLLLGGTLAPVIGAIVFFAWADAEKPHRQQYDFRIGQYHEYYDYPAANRQSRLRLLGGLAIASTVPLAIASLVVGCIFLYKAWNLIGDGRPRTSPGLAVGLLFVPLFNFYWIFVAYYGLAVDMNRYAERRGIPMKPVAAGLGLTYCILTLCGLLPLVNVLVLIPTLAVYLIFLNSVKNGAAAIAQAKLQGVD